MKKPSMTAGTKSHRSAVTMKKESMAKLKKSMAKKLDIEVTRGDDDIMFDKDTGETGQTRSKKVQEAMKFEEYNNKIRERNKAKNQKELDKGFKEIEDMADGKRPFDQKRFDEISAREKAIREGDFEGGEKLYKVKYSGEDLKQRKLAGKGKYTYERGKNADVYDLKNKKDIAGKGGGYEESTDKKIREGRKKRKEAITKMVMPKDKPPKKAKKPATKMKKVDEKFPRKLTKFDKLKMMAKKSKTTKKEKDRAKPIAKMKKPAVKLKHKNK